MSENIQIDDGYWDVDGNWHPTQPATREAILAAANGERPRGDSPAEVDPVCVVRQGESRCLHRPGTLQAEDGSTRRLEGDLPTDLPLGYYDFLDDAGGATRVVVAPRQCVVPAEPKWGWSVQLYAARSRRSWGFGDLADLRLLGDWSADLGAGLMMVNPLLAVAPGEGQEASPYYPATRRFRNPLYLCVEEAPGAEILGEELCRLAAIGRAMNAGRLIDRPAVYRLKFEALRKIWERFRQQEAPREYTDFLAAGGQALDDYGLYCAMAEQRGGDWRGWPQEFRDPRGTACRGFAVENADEIAFHRWLQWACDRQLAAAASSLPLIQDLPIGVDPGGLDAWVWQDTLATTCTVGAPPDPFQRQGQNWSLPPFIPNRLRRARYEPFIQSVRASLRHSAGLRIDHVMGLFRLFWIPLGRSPAEGTYVRYPADEMLAILALESHRHQAFICGEDLGTVEPAVREALHAHAMLAFRLLYFESIPPREYPPLAMAAVSTHDLPTVAGAWAADPPPPIDGFPPPNRTHPEIRDRLKHTAGIADSATPPEAIEATYRKLAEAPSLVLLASLDDAAAVREQPNLPGTTDEWPNWSLALPGGLESLAESDLPRRLAQAMRRSAEAAPQS